MNNLGNLNAALGYIESKLDAEIHMQDIARIMCCSSYNVQRMFSFLAGVPLSEYIRNRRLTLAAMELQQGLIQVNDVSAKYGYNSPTAFNRAFTAFHGIAPGAAKQQGATLKVYPRMTFSVSITGGTELTYRIEKICAFKAMGIEIAAPLNEEGFQMPAKLWLDSFQNGKMEALCALAGEQTITDKPYSLPVYGIFNHRGLGDELFSYMVACKAPDMGDNPDFCAADIPEQTYVIFQSNLYAVDDRSAMKNKVHEVQRRFYGEWLPTVSYEKEDGPEIEVYYQDGRSAWVELWYPIRNVMRGAS